MSTSRTRTLAENRRATALAAGDLVQRMLRETRALLQQANGDRFDAMALGLMRLRNDGHITPADQTRLQTLFDAVRIAQGQPDIDARVIATIRTTYHDLVADQQARPVSVAIASLTNNLVTPTERTDADGTLTFSVVKTRVEGAGAVLIGAMVGAGVGGEIGGLPGAGIGAIIGGVVGAVAGQCEIEGQ
jgi:hypothetical protein